MDRRSILAITPPSFEDHVAFAEPAIRPILLELRQRISVKFDRPFRDTRRKQHWRSSNDDYETTGRCNRIRGLTLPVTAKELSNRGKYR